MIYFCALLETVPKVQSKKSTGAVSRAGWVPKRQNSKIKIQYKKIPAKGGLSHQEAAVYQIVNGGV